MPADDYRLTTREIARFAADGYLRFDGLVPTELNEAVVERLGPMASVKISQALGVPSDQDIGARPVSRTPLSECYPDPSPIGAVLRLPQVQGIIRSLVGDDPFFDHDFVHVLSGGSTYLQHLHMDAITDSSDPTFDIQLFYFPRAVRTGGTRFVPGSHLRRVRPEQVARYQHIAGEEFYEGEAGTVLVFHHGLWHAGQPNPGEETRWMYKIRLNPRVPQVRLWNTDDFAAVHNDPSDHTFATMRVDSVANTLRQLQPWQQGHEGRIELVQRARLWRYLSGDPTYDADYYLTRLEDRAGLLGEDEN